MQTKFKHKGRYKVLISSIKFEGYLFVLLKQYNTGKECINNGHTKIIRKSKLIYKCKKLKFLFLSKVTCFRWTISKLASKAWDWWIWSIEVVGTHPRVVKRALVASHNSSRLLEGGNPKKVDGNPLTSLSRLTKAVKEGQFWSLA